MKKSTALFWLGRQKDGPEAALPYTACRAPGGQGQDAPRLERSSDPALSATDRRFIDDSIRLFEEAFLFFDLRGDREGQRMVDELALSLVNLIRAYLVARTRR